MRLLTASSVGTSITRLAAVLVFLLAQLVSPFEASAQSGPRCSFDVRYPVGTVFALDGTPHLWVTDSTGAPRWAGDTRALAGITVRWDSRCSMDMAFAGRVPQGDPLLSAGLVKIGDPIYLAKWETQDPAPTLLHIQSIADVELFGINGNNYGRFVLGGAEWQLRYGFNVDTLRRGELPAVVGAAPPGRFPFLDPPLNDIEFSCLPANPSCTRDPWWVEWNELQRSDMVEYRVAPGLVLESRFIEAVWLIWQWPEGKELLREAGTSGVSIVTAPAEALPKAFAAYLPAVHMIGVSRRFTETSTWMVADVLVHELKHASDDARGLFRGAAYEVCITREQRAYSAESRYVGWLVARFDGLPNSSQIANRLSLEDFELFVNIQAIATAPDPSAMAARDYRQGCTQRSSA